MIRGAALWWIGGLSVVLFKFKSVTVHSRIRQCPEHHREMNDVERQVRGAKAGTV